MPSGLYASPSIKAESDEDWDGGEEDGDLFQTMDDQPVLVNPGVFIGSFMAEHNKESCQAAGITHILQVCALVALSLTCL